MEGTIKYVNPEQKYGYIKAEVTFDLIVLENSRRYADNIVLQEHGPRKHGKLKISNPYAPSKIENQIAENKESCAIISELISKSRGTKETVFPFNDYAYLPTYYQHRPENQWLIGKPSGYWINGNSLLYLKIKKQIRYQGTAQWFRNMAATACCWASMFTRISAHLQKMPVFALNSTILLT